MTAVLQVLRDIAKHLAVPTTALIAALPASHRAARKKVVTLSALAGEDFILPPQEQVPVFHDLVLRACRDAGFVPNAAHEADHLQLVLAMVGAGAGVALVPEFVRNDKEPGVATTALRCWPHSLRSRAKSSERRVNVRARKQIEEFASGAV